MALLRVTSDSTEKLLEQPETGMGYQIIYDRGIRYLVFNSLIALPFSDYKSNRIDSRDVEYLSGNPDLDELPAWLELISFSNEAETCVSILDKQINSSDPGITLPDVVSGPPAWLAKVPRSYYRFSPFHKDRRIDPNGDFRPGTYATTFNDLAFVPSGFAAVGRYALPNPASACQVFQIVTWDPPTYMGTATPNFGQAGGGVEVLFKNGARPSPAASFPISVG